MASKEYHRIREIIASRRSSSGRPVDIEKFRGNMESTARSLPAKVKGLMIDAGGVPGELQATSEASENHLIIYFHGGGWVIGRYDWTIKGMNEKQVELEHAVQRTLVLEHFS